MQLNTAQLSPKKKTEFIELYHREFDIVLSPCEADKILEQLFGLVSAVLDSSLWTI